MVVAISENLELDCKDEHGEIIDLQNDRQDKQMEISRSIRYASRGG